MVFGGQITFSTPPKKIRPPHFFSAPDFFFGGFLVFSAPKTKNKKSAFSAGAYYREQYFSAPKQKNLGFFFFFGAASLWCSAAK